MTADKDTALGQANRLGNRTAADRLQRARDETLPVAIVPPEALDPGGDKIAFGNNGKTPVTLQRIDLGVWY